MAKNLQVVMVPWLAFGHMIPYAHLAVALARHGVRVLYVSTPRNVQRLPQIPSSLSDLMEYVTLAMPQVEGLPDAAEATSDVTFDQIQYLKAAYDKLSPQVDQIITSQSPNWIISDFAPYWIVNISEKHGIPFLFFPVLGAASRAFLGPHLVETPWKVEASVEALTSKPEWIPFNSLVAFRKYEAQKYMAGMHQSNASGVTDRERVAMIISGCQAMIIRSCKELEGEYIDLLETIFNKPVIPGGVLLQKASNDSEKVDESWNEVFKWLDGRMPRSVVFVGFGSEYELTKEEVHEIAYSLEISQLPFLWVLTKPKWADDDSDILPSEFRETTRDRGTICLGWAPQQKILAHKSIGGSLIHCGWGSILETLQHGHTIVALPFHVIDQGLCARLLVEKDLAVEVERGEDGSFERDQVAKALRRAMVDDEGEKTRACARKAGTVVGDEKLQLETYVGGLVHYMTVQKDL